jgi:TatD DNase family protein
MIADSHLHLRQLCLQNKECVEFLKKKNHYSICSCHSDNDLKTALNFAGTKNSVQKMFFISYGVHPFDNDIGKLNNVERLAKDKIIDAVGEAGIDRFTPELNQTIKIQTEIFSSQIDIALKYSLPLVIHVRKAVEELLSFSGRLAKIPAVIFHCYSGTFQEAEYILNKKVNGYFSFGTPLVNGSKKAMRTFSKIPFERILLETDAPYQPFKGRSYTDASDITEIYATASQIKNISEKALQEKIFCNFKNIFDKQFELNTNHRMTPGLDGDKNEF